MSASPNAFMFVQKYFGTEWHSYALKKGWVTSSANSSLQDSVTEAYNLLTPDDRQKLVSFISTIRFNAAENGLFRSLLSIVSKKDYSAFYDQLVSNLHAGEFNSADIHRAFMNMINARAAPGATGQAKADESIIDITGKPQPINYGSTPAPDRIYSYNTISNEVRTSYGYDEIRLGSKYRDKLKLSKQEVGWLNKFWNPNNVFLSIEGCCVATIHLYTAVMKDLVAHLRLTNNTLAAEIDRLFNLASREYGRHDEFFRERLEVDVYWTIFKRTENAVRLAYHHKRKVDEGFTYGANILAVFDERIGKPVNQLIDANRYSIATPDEDTLVALNQENVNRWKTEFDELEKILATNGIAAFVDNTYKLGNLNRKNPSLENIYFEASKLTAKIDRAESVKFYLNYLFADLQSAKVDNKQLNKTIQKALFKTNDEVQEFEKLVAELLKDRNIGVVTARAAAIFEKKRKRIRLDAGIINEVKGQHDLTVCMLNEFLDDEYEDESNTIKMTDTGNDEIQISICPKTAVETSAFVDNITLTGHQEALLKQFEAGGLRLSADSLDAFARDNGLFRNQMVDSINESCFELLDDVLIEEDGQDFTINQDYFNKIKRV